jgi:hypothetical protein
VLCPELDLPLLEPLDGGLPLVGVALGDGAIEDETPHPAGVCGGASRGGHPCLAAQVAIQRLQARAGARVIEVDSDGVVAKVGSHARGRRGQVGKIA